MQGRDVRFSGEGERCLDQQIRHERVRVRSLVEESGACGRGEGDRHHELWVVLQTRPGVGVRPRPVEHELAVRMRFCVHRHCTEQLIPLMEKDVTGRPPRFVARAAVRFQRGEELVSHERIALARNSIPRCGIDGCEAADDFRAIPGAVYFGHRPHARRSSRNARFARRSADGVVHSEFRTCRLPGAGCITDPRDRPGISPHPAPPCSRFPPR